MSHRPRKRFGQHFLHDPQCVAKIVAAIDPKPDDPIVEIGPGQGVLTRPLLERVDRLHAIELDRDLIVDLLRRLPTDRLVLHEGDALAFDFAALVSPGQRLRIVGNLPYNISTPLLFKLLQQRERIRDMVFLLQREVVQRMVAAPGTKQYGRLTVMLSMYADIEHLFDIGPGAFKPPPKVWSSVVRVSPRAEPRSEIFSPEMFAKIVAGVFSKRRKTLANGLKPWLSRDDIANLGIDPGVRGERLAPEVFAAIANLAAENAPIAGRAAHE